MYTENSLKEELLLKLEKEQDEYKEKVREKGVDYAIEKAYEISSRQEIIDCINTIDIEPKAIKALLKTENVLDDFYNEWLDIDGNLYETFEYAIEIKIEQLSDEFYSKEDKDFEQENKSVKTQNKARDCR